MKDPTLKAALSIDLVERFQARARERQQSPAELLRHLIETEVSKHE